MDKKDYRDNKEKDCRHVWHSGGTARGISLATPEFQDDVCVFLYCPKCLETMTLVYRINKERTHTEADQPLIDTVLKQQAAASMAQIVAEEIEALKARLTRNLSKLNYSPDRVQNILSKLKYDANLVESLSGQLHEEHRPMIKALVSGDLVS